MLDPWQAEVLRSPSKRTLMLCSRQSGKSTTAAIMSIGQAVTAPGSLTLLVSPSLRQSTELFRTVMGYFRKLSDAPEILAEFRYQVRVGERFAHRQLTWYRGHDPGIRSGEPNRDR